MKRATLVVGILVFGAALLSSCAHAPDPAPTAPVVAAPESVSDAGEGCLRTVGAPDVDVQAANRDLPIPGVREEFVQAEVMVVRGAGACAAEPAGGGARADKCAPLTMAAHDSVSYVLWSSADALTEAMFAAGGEVALSETMTGYAGSGADTFTYRMVAWRFSDDPDLARTPLGELLMACDTVGSEVFLGNDRLVLAERGDLVAAAWQRDETVFLIESIHPLDTAGKELRHSPTASGLLPKAAMNAIQVWWDETAPHAMADRQPASRD